MHEGAASDTVVTVETRYVHGTLPPADEVYGLYPNYLEYPLLSVIVSGVDTAT